MPLDTHKEMVEGGGTDGLFFYFTVTGVCYYPSSLLGSDCTNLSSPHGGDVSFSVSGEARMNCSEDSDFCTGTESLFFNLMQL